LVESHEGEPAVLKTKGDNPPPQYFLKGCDLKERIQTLTEDFLKREHEE
jgi:hypothetical protein